MTCLVSEVGAYCHTTLSLLTRGGYARLAAAGTGEEPTFTNIAEEPVGASGETQQPQPPALNRTASWGSTIARIRFQLRIAR